MKFLSFVAKEDSFDEVFARKQKYNARRLFKMFPNWQWNL